MTGTEARHALRVLRVRQGEQIVVLDGVGQTLTCDVAETTKKTLSLKVAERKIHLPLPCAVTLFQAIPKGRIIENIIQKAVELGASRIVPILSERVVTQLDSENGETKAGKWQHVAIEAIKQCGSPWLPKVEAPIALQSCLARSEKFELPLVASLETGSHHPRECFDGFFSEWKRLPKSVGLWIGPEGDFTAAEYGAVKNTGALPITLGPLVLRVETAATYCLSLVNYELQAKR